MQSGLRDRDVCVIGADEMADWGECERTFSRNGDRFERALIVLGAGDGMCRGEVAVIRGEATDVE